MDPIFLEVLGAVLRWGLAILSSALVTRHIISGPQSEQFATALSHLIIFWLPAGGALLWSVWKRYLNYRRRNDPMQDRRAPIITGVRS